MIFSSINPYTLKIVEEYKAHSPEEVEAILTRADESFQHWRHVPFSKKSEMMNKAAQVLEANVDRYAAMITLEMGKPLLESRAEVKKCAWVCRYYAEHAKAFLKPDIIKTDADSSLVKYDPMGAILAIMPWNFPFWQVFRFAAPTLMAGNTGILKHAPNVCGSALLIDEVFRHAGFPEGVFHHVFIHHDDTEMLIAHPGVRAVTLTGSERAGSAVASLAGRYLKKSLLELGGNNAFIVMEDADIDRAVKVGLTARMMNAGQSCIAAKRFIAVGSAYRPFVDKFTAAVRELKTGDPTAPDTRMGPLARVDLAEQLHDQLNRSVDAGAKLLYGGAVNGACHQPTVIENVGPGMPAFDEETFGPLAAMIYAASTNEAIDLAIQSKYGLGVSIFTGRPDEAIDLASRFHDGAVFINELVKSDPRLPFGGTRRSGYGRELAREGILEFVNVQTVYMSR